jgi:hypothetical protein
MYFDEEISSGISNGKEILLKNYFALNVDFAFFRFIVIVASYLMCNSDTVLYFSHSVGNVTQFRFKNTASKRDMYHLN